MNIRDYLASRAPWLGPMARNFRARRDALLPRKSSYAQHGEDEYILKQLSAYDLRTGVYVDVGASHPTTISNTYLFYRNGYSGVIVEPNLEYVALHRKFRPRDTAIGIGCGARTELAAFQVSKTPVLSRFLMPSNSDASLRALGGEELRVDHVPIFPLDVALKSVQAAWIYLLSIDVEGLDLQVLQGAAETLPKVLFVCVEANDEAQQAGVEEFLASRGFRLEKRIECNLIFRNSVQSFAVHQNGDRNQATCP